MDQKEMMERLKRDPAALQAVMQSQDGQMLLRLLSGSDGGRTLQQAVRQAAAGDASAMSQMLQGIMSSPRGAALVQRIGESLQNREGGTAVSELEEKLNALLSDPNSMAQVMQMAQQLSGAMGEQKAAAPPPPSPVPPAPDLGAALGGLDPKLLGKLLPLAGELGTENSAAMQLLNALRPFLKEEKQGKIQRAARLARLIHVGKKLLADWEG